jgi:transcriptional regulator with XRE-family HTH domain
MNSSNNFRTWINNFRHSKELTLEELASKIGVSKSAVANYASVSSRDPSPSYGFLKKLAKTFPDLEMETLHQFIPDNKAERLGIVKKKLAPVQNKSEVVKAPEEGLSIGLNEVLRQKDEYIKKIEEENHDLKEQVKQLINIVASMNKKVA